MQTIKKTMKTLKHLTALALTASFLATPLAVLAADKTDKPAEKVKPFTLTTCPVSGEKLGAMGTSFTFTNDNREIKLCCKACKKDFDKDPAKYLKQIEEAEKAAAAKK
jgi:YHS domain-containing protein